MPDSNPFAQESAWDVSELPILPAGDHVVEVASVDGTGWSKNGYPQIEVKAKNDDGMVTDWIVVIPSTIGRVVQLTEALGLDRPKDNQVSEDREGYRLDANYLKAMVGRKVGVIVRDEPRRDDPSKTRTTIKGWVPVEKLNDSGTPTGPVAMGKPGKPASDDDLLPF
jgi:hypothetical protein